MKMSKWVIFFCSLIILGLVSFLVFNQKNKRILEETFLKALSKKVFNEKLSKEHPKWMDEQIELDFSSFTEKKVTLSAIDETFDKITKKVPYHSDYSFIRYRIIDNKLYRYYPKNTVLNTLKPPFERAIKTLTKLVKLPNLDLIYSDMDGTVEFYLPQDFYVVDDFENQAPIFSRAKKVETSYVVLIPDYHAISNRWVDDCTKILNYSKKYPWTEKEQIAFWRGASSDKAYNLENYKTKPRVLISSISLKNPQLVDAALVITDQVQLKDILVQEGLVKKSASIEDHFKYKYLPVLDGYMCTYPGYQWRLLSNSVCFKQTSDEIQWFYLALKPYEHYVPIANDMSDIVDKVIWAKTFDDKCQKIAKNATDFVINNLMIEDNYLYLYKVLLSYSSHLNIDKKMLYQNTIKDDSWVCIQDRKKAKEILKEKF